jgi:hypothetical protein
MTERWSLESNWPSEALEVDIHTPAYHVPRFTDVAKLGRARAGVAVGNGESSALDSTGSVGEHNITRHYLSEKIVIRFREPSRLRFGDQM